MAVCVATIIGQFLEIGFPLTFRNLLEILLELRSRNYLSGRFVVVLHTCTPFLKFYVRKADNPKSTSLFLLEEIANGWIKIRG